MKKAVFIFFAILSSTLLYSQGANNDYSYDMEDVKNIFQMQGINTFKFPFQLKKGEYISISYEVYEFEKKIKSIDIIEDFQIKNDFIIDHHIAKKDTTIYHRFYFMTENDSLIIKSVLPGITSTGKIDISKVAISDMNSWTGTKRDLSEKQAILFYYANYKGSKNYKEQDGWLSCTTDISKDMLIHDYDLVILFYAEKIDAVRAKNILQEEKYKHKSLE